MNLLLCRETADGLEIPDFGPDFAAHIAAKKHPAVRRSSVSAWSLLADGLAQLGYERLPNVIFGQRGKPVFSNCPLHFSISHSGGMAAALISPAPCALDIEHLRPEVSARLMERCLSDAERRKGLSFLDAWTKKECICKLDGSGLPSRPAEIDTLDPRLAGCFFTHEIEDSGGRKYILTALCRDGKAPRIQK